MRLNRNQGNQGLCSPFRDQSARPVEWRKRFTSYLIKRSLSGQLTRWLDHPETRTTSSLHAGPAPRDRTPTQVSQCSQPPLRLGDFSCCLPGYRHRWHLSVTYRWAEMRQWRIQQELVRRTWDRQRFSPNRQTEADKGKLMRRAAGRQSVVVPQPWLRRHHQLIANDPVLSGTR